MDEIDPIARLVATVRSGDVRTAGALLATVDPQTPRDEVLVDVSRGYLLCAVGFDDDATQHTREALARARAMGDAELEVEALLAHAHTLGTRQDATDSLALLERAASLAPPGTRSQAEVQLRWGAAATRARDLPLAERRLQRALALFEAVEDRAGVAEARLHLAKLRIREGRLPEARQLARELQAAVGDGTTGSRAMLENLLAQLDHLHGDLEGAEQHLARASTLYGTLGLLTHQADCSSNRGEVLRAAGRLEDARQQYTRLLAVPLNEGTALLVRLNLAIVELELGRAREAAEQASALQESTDRPLGWISGLVQALLAVHPDAAPDAAGQSLRLARGHLLEHRIAEPDILLVLQRVGKVFEARGEVELAAGARGVALDYLEGVGGTPEAIARERAALQRLRAAGAPVWLGSTRLDAVLGRGGMGTVWRARDRLTGRDVALKVIAGHDDGSSSSEQAAASLGREVRQVAGLHHPAIVEVIDTGLVPASSSALSGGRLVAGSPWVAMELVEGGTLKDLLGKLDWPAARDVLRVLLDALAHAHARGMVHMDLKPANVLVAFDGEGNPKHIKLTDFGIARGFREAASEALTGGTPRYMAPEQVRKQGRIVGPWTDLYALGCLAMELVSGAPPFRGSRTEVLQAHLHREPPALRAVCAVPEGLQGWLHRLLEKHPLDRFLRAADASLALSALDGQPMVPVDGNPDVPLQLGAADTWVLDDVCAEPLAEPELDPPGLAPIPTPLCPAHPPADPPPQARRGLAMLGHRAPAPIGRAPQRARLWGALHEVHTQGRAQWLELVAPAGLRAHALCEWLAFRAHEVGVASPLILRRGARLSTAIARPLGLEGLTGAPLRRQLAARGRAWRLDGAMVEALARSLEEDDAERHGELWLQAGAVERSIIVVLEEPTERQRAMLAGLHGRGLPMLAVSHRDPLGEPPRQEAPTTLAMEPLSDEELFAGLVDPPLAPELRWELVERSEGCEEVVFRTLSSYVEQGRLVDGPGGLARRPDFRTEFRVDADPTWRGRIERWRTEVDEEVWGALELVCVVPEPVPVDRVGRSCAAVLLARGWVREVPGGLLPRVSGLRRAVRVAMQGEGRLVAAARACAEAGGWTLSATAALWQWARQPEAAEQAYRGLVAEELRAGRPQAAAVAWRRWDRTTKQLGLSADDPRRVEGLQLRERVRALSHTATDAPPG